jgi:hypothetical protein
MGKEILKLLDLPITTLIQLSFIHSFMLVSKTWELGLRGDGESVHSSSSFVS